MPGRKPRATGLPARIRAAVAYADLSQRTVADAMGISVSTVNRWMTGPGETGYRPPDADERAALAHTCAVPTWFIERDWSDGEDTSDLADRVERLEAMLGTRPADLPRISAQLAAVRGDLEQLLALIGRGPQQDDYFAMVRRTLESVISQQSHEADQRRSEPATDQGPAPTRAA